MLSQILLTVQHRTDRSEHPSTPAKAHDGIECKGPAGSLSLCGMLSCLPVPL